MDILWQAKDYVYICTPYLIIDHEMYVALSMAAKRGVDVRIVVPGIPDKKTVYELTKSYFKQLIKEGKLPYIKKEEDEIRKVNNLPENAPLKYNFNGKNIVVTKEGLREIDPSGQFMNYK